MLQSSYILIGLYIYEFLYMYNYGKLNLFSIKQLQNNFLLIVNISNFLLPTYMKNLKEDRNIKE